MDSTGNILPFPVLSEGGSSPVLPSASSAQVLPFRPPGGVSLGKYAKSTTPPRIDEESGEILYDRPDPVVLRVERFALQSAARRILPGSRTAECLRAFVPTPKGVAPPMPEVWRSRQHGSCRYRKLLVCGSVWACPVCASIISERRRLELLSAISQHKAAGGDVLLLTLTTPHQLVDRLSDVLAGQAVALGQHFFKGASMKRLYASIGYVGQVRALEVTHGRLRERNNGWHPHYHILLFVRAGLDLAKLELAFFKRWLAACEKACLGAPSWEHGVRLHDGTEAAYYAGKWGLESEMTKGHIKKVAKEKGETPFQLLRAFLYDGDRQAAALFKEFAQVFKGKRQLFWSRGLKSHFHIDEVDDEEAVQGDDDVSDLLGRIDFDDWRLILKFDVRADVLELARIGWEPIERLLSDLRLNGR